MRLGRDVLYVSGDPSGLFRSVDGGTTWEFLTYPGVGGIKRIAVDPRDDARLLVGGERGLALSLDGGKHWRGTGITRDVRAVAFGKDDVAWCATDRQLWRSRSAGSWWEPAGLQGGCQADVAPDPGDPATVWVGTTLAPESFERPGLMRSVDFSETFQMNDAGLRAVRVGELWPSADGSSPVLLADGSSLLWAWEGAGARWRVVQPIKDGWVVSADRDPVDADRVVAMVGTLSAENGHEQALYVSEDGGWSWSRSSETLRTSASWQLAVDPFSTNRVFGVAVGVGDRMVVFHPVDGELDYTLQGEGTLYSVVASKTTQGVVLATSRTQVWRSTDSGETWKSVDVPAEMGSLRCLEASSTGPIYLLSRVGRVSRSDDAGASWSLRGRFGDVDCDYGDLAVSPTNPDVVAGVCTSEGRSENERDST